MAKVHNVPAYAWNNYYMVVNVVDGEYWYYSCWTNDHGEEAMRQCWEIGGELLRVNECEDGDI